MTKEEAIQIIDSLDPAVMIKTTASNKQIREAIDMAVKALSKPSLPSDLDEAAEDCIQGLITEAELPATTPFALEYVIEMLYKTFKAGAEWMAGQGVSMQITDDTEWEEVDSFIHKNVDGCSIIQIRKK